ncbi:MAG: trypsin-like peptidase domain-containing protein [Lentisphaerae bacterium]|nr:trypsin-like peptidase domain-containing protein [Lentisphaerota bacterium]
MRITGPLLAVLLTLVAAAPGRAAGLAPDPAPVDDAAFQRELAREVAALNDGGRLTPIATLRAQLDRTRARVRLPSPASAGTARPAAADGIPARESALVMCELYKCGKCSEWHVSCSSCFAVAPDIVVFNHHALATNRTTGSTAGLAIARADGSVFAVREVLAASAANDVAAVRIDGGPLAPLALAPAPPAGTEVTVISHPAGLFFTVTRGVVARHFVEGVRKGPRVPRMAITADFAKGSSGAPVLTRDGAVVGMVASTRSIYYDEKDGEQRNLQMVVKSCVPARSILALFEAP